MLLRVRPLFAALCALLVGIFAAPIFSFPPLVWFALAFASLAAAFTVPPRMGRVVPFLFYLTFALFGAGQTKAALTPNPDDLFQFAGRPSLWVNGIVASDVEEGERGTYSFLLDVRQTDNYETKQPASGKVRVFLAPSEPPFPGEEVWLRGRVELPAGQTNPGGFDYRAYLARRGVRSVLSVKRADDLRHVDESSSLPIVRAASIGRKIVQRELEAHLAPPDAALLGGLLLSIRSKQLGAELTDAFSRTGTVHLLSVSGLHMATVAAVLALAMGLFSAPRLWKNLLAIGLLWLLALASGGGAAPCRSAIMATVVLAAPLLRREADLFHSLALAALLILGATPLVIYDAGFQLTFVTVAALTLWLPPLEAFCCPWEPTASRFSHAVRWLLLALLVGVIAQAGSAPLVAFHYNQVSFIAPLAGVIVAPLSEILLLLGFAAVAVSFLPGWVTAPIWAILSGGLELLRFLVLAFGSVPGASFSIESPPAFWLVLYYLLLGGLAVIVRRWVTQKTIHAPLPAVAAAFAGGDHRLSQA